MPPIYPLMGPNTASRNRDLKVYPHSSFVRSTRPTLTGIMAQLLPMKSVLCYQVAVELPTGLFRGRCSVYPDKDQRYLYVFP